ncbi:MAG: hypothetical protein JSU80_12850 [Deltaproteobacteria bacterium]|nr:MAG: hypothetical protein JSU80_12850 [Deltaproteobacteria bacterium]
MKKMIVFVLLIVTVIFLFASPLLAQKQKDTSVGVLSETYFVVVQSRGADDSSVLLYRVYDGKMYLQDALVVDGEFADISRPTIRVLRPSQYSPGN